MCHREAVRSRTSERAGESSREDDFEDERGRPGPTAPVALVSSRLAPFVASKRAKSESETERVSR